jgi:hypothetical protein
MELHPLLLSRPMVDLRTRAPWGAFESVAASHGVASAVALAPNGRLTDAGTMGRIERLQQEMGLDAQTLKKILRRKKSSLVAALDKDYLWCGMERLKRKFGFDAKKLQTFLQKNSVVAALGKDFFWRGMEQLQREMKFDAQTLVTFVCDSVASRLDKEYFWNGIERLQRELGFNARLLVTFVRDSVTAALGKDFFWRGIKRLQREMEFDAQALVTFVCDSVASRLDKEYFWNGIERFLNMRFRSERPIETGKKPFTKDLLKKLMHCGSVAVGFERPSF